MTTPRDEAPTSLAVHRFERGGIYAVIAHLSEHSTQVAIDDACRLVSEVMGVANLAGASILGTVHVGDRPIDVKATAPVDLSPMPAEQRVRHALAHQRFARAVRDGLGTFAAQARADLLAACMDIVTALDSEGCPFPVASASREFLGALAVLHASDGLPAATPEDQSGLVRAAVETAAEIGRLTRAAVERAKGDRS